MYESTYALHVDRVSCQCKYIVAYHWMDIIEVIYEGIKRLSTEDNLITSEVLQRMDKVEMTTG